MGSYELHHGTSFGNKDLVSADNSVIFTESLKVLVMDLKAPQEKAKAHTKSHEG